MGVVAILVMWPRPRQQTFVPPSHWGSMWNLALIVQVVLEKKIFENGGQRTDDRPWLYYKLTNEPKRSGEPQIILFSDSQTIGIIWATTWENLFMPYANKTKA